LRIIGYSSGDAKARGPATRVVAYYDRSNTNTWWAYLADDDGYQLCDAAFGPRRGDAVQALGHQAMVLDLPKTLRMAYDRLSPTEPKSAYDCGFGTSLETLRNLAKRGLAREVTPPGAGGMFSPRTHYKFVRVEE